MTQAIHNLMRPNYSEGSAPVALTQHLLDLIARIQAIVIQFVQTILPFLFRESPTLTPGKVEVVVQHQAPPPPQANPLPAQNGPPRAPEAAQVINLLLPIQRIAEEALPAIEEPEANPQIEEALPIENNQRPVADPAELVVQAEVDPQPAEVAQGLADEIPAPNEAIGGPVVEADVDLQHVELIENQGPEVPVAAINELVAQPQLEEAEPLVGVAQAQPGVGLLVQQFELGWQPAPDDQERIIIQVEGPGEQHPEPLDEVHPSPRRNLLLSPDWNTPQQRKPSLSPNADTEEHNFEVSEFGKAAINDSEPKGNVSKDYASADIMQLPTEAEGNEALRAWLTSVSSKENLVSRARNLKDPVLCLKQGIEGEDMPAAIYVAIQGIKVLGGRSLNDPIEDETFQGILKQGVDDFFNYDPQNYSPEVLYSAILKNFRHLRSSHNRKMTVIYNNFRYKSLCDSESITETPKSLATPDARKAATKLALRVRVTDLINGLICVIRSQGKQTGGAVLFRGAPNEYDCRSYAVFVCSKGREPVIAKGKRLGAEFGNYAIYLLIPYSHNSEGLVLERDESTADQAIGMALYKFKDAEALAGFINKIDPPREEDLQEGCWLHALVQADSDRQSRLVSPSIIGQRVGKQSSLKTPSQNLKAPSLDLTTPTPARETVKRTPKTIRRSESILNSDDIQSKNSVSNPLLILERLGAFADQLVRQTSIVTQDLDDILANIESDESSLIEDKSFLTNIQEALPKSDFRLIDDERFKGSIGQEDVLKLLPSVARVHADPLAGAVVTKGDGVDRRMYVIFIIKKSETEYKYMVLNPNTEDNKLLLHPLLSESLSYSFGRIDPILEDEPISITLFKQKKNYDQDDEKTFEKT
jgi:hypothetical protein